MGHDVCMLAFSVGGVGKIESSGHASRIGIGVVIWDGGNTGGVGEADCNRSRVGCEVVRFAQR